MQLSTHFGRLELAASAKQDVADMILSAIERFGTRVRKVSISIRDINGTKGGEDKRCRCVVYLKRMPPIVIEDTGENCRSLLHRVADRVTYTLSQRLDRFTKSSRSCKSRTRAAEITFLPLLND